MRAWKTIVCRGATFVVFALFCSITDADAIGFDIDDFIVSRYQSGGIAVYDKDLTFKGQLNANYVHISGLGFDAVGRVVAGIQTPYQSIRVFDATGMEIHELSITNPQIGGPFDIKVGPNGTYFVASQPGLNEFSTDGTLLRQLSADHFLAVAVLPDGVVWGGTDGNQQAPGRLEVFDLASGGLVGEVPLDGGQISTASMFYSRLTNTVLLADKFSAAVFERRTNGELVRTFRADGLRLPYGVTRGPNGEVYAVDHVTGIFRWSADGTFLGLAPFWGQAGILWAGNLIVPEPISLLTCLHAALLFGVMRKTRCRRPIRCDVKAWQ